MGHWHDARDPRDPPGKVSAEHDAVERGAGAFLNPQISPILSESHVAVAKRFRSLATACQTPFVSSLMT